MAGSVNAGSVIYEVDIDTSRLLQGRREIDAALNGLGGSMGRLEASVTRTERSLGSMQRTMSGLSGVAKGLLAALSLQQVAQWGNEWVTVSNKLSNAVRANENLADVTQRVFDISQNTMSDLSSTATLYSRLERSTRSAGTSTADLITLTSTINKGLAVSGATTQEASSTMIQLSQALASGVLRGEEFNSISENGSRLAVALADSLGVTIGQLRGMAAQGKLTTDVVVKGLLKQSDAIAKEFSNTVMTMGQAFTVAGNSVTKFVGENSSANATINVFNKGLITLSDNIDIVANAVGAAALVFGGRFVGALAMATAAQATKLKTTIQSVAASRQEAQQELATSLALQRKIVLDKEASLATLKRVEEQYLLAKGTAAEAIAYENLIRVRSIYIGIAAEEIAVNNAVAASQAKLAATGVTVSNSMKLINTVTAPLGGPLGAIAIVAAGWYLYAQRQEEARKKAIAFADTVPEVIKKLKDMNLVQAQGVRADTVTSIKAQEEALKELNNEISDLAGRYKDANIAASANEKGTWLNNDATEAAANLEIELAQKIRDRDSAQLKLKDTQSALHLVNIQVNQGIVDQMKAARDNAIALKDAEKEASFLGGTQSFLAQKFGQTTEAIKEFNSESLKMNWGGSDGEKLIKQAKRRLALAKVEGDARAKLQATYDAEDAGVTGDKEIKELQGVYVKTNQATEARKEQKKEDKAAASEAKKLENQQESIAQKLENLRRQTESSAESTQDLSREQAILAAQQSLGKGATQEQIALAGKYRAEVWDTANALKAQAAAEKLLPENKENASYKQDMKDLQTALSAKKISQEQYNQTAERLEQQHQVNLAKIRAEGVVSPTAQAKGEIDPVQQLANQHAQELAMIQQFETQKGQITQRGLELMNAANEQYEQQRIAAQWEIWRQQGTGYEVAAAAFDSFAGNASNALTGIITGSMTVSEAMRSLGSTVLNSVINSFVQMGVEWAKSVIMGQIGMSAASAATIAQGQLIAASMAPAAAMTSLATAGANAVPAQAGIASTVGVAQALSIAGMRKNGGPVTAGSMYQVGEGGMPEIYQSNSGKQYMIPGDNGSVISNKDMQGGSVQVNVKFYDQTSGGQHSFEAQAMQDGGVVTVEAFLNDMDRGGPMSSGMQQHFGLSRKANGDF
ncbi:hypothetical protein CHU32_09825 [Superficieibacter electus]|uniref:Uncharacterized protein n=1 Tax=Superficieibacter electus TaxID=2022662 RepID=A0A2P5GQS6_9ENTR|nr:tape measure protein [Superficieibacter electus]POP43369.1 hypothetical protein CHU33_15940 [Superficieibacter electus]POP48886.1 hypothetical protein CHU32_09825 [Superficieibacter electus]